MSYYSIFPYGIFSSKQAEDWIGQFNRHDDSYIRGNRIVATPVFYKEFENKIDAESQYEEWMEQNSSFFDYFKMSSEYTDDRKEIEETRDIMNRNLQRFRIVMKYAKNAGAKKTHLKEMKRGIGRYEDLFAQIIEFYMSTLSDEEKVSIIVPSEIKNLGKAVKTGSLDPNTDEWVADRRMSFGGSDVAVIARHEAVLRGHIDKESDEGKLAELSYKGLLKSKGPNGQIRPFSKSEMKPAGPLYRGTALEGFLLESYAEEEVNRSIVGLDKNQYSHPDKPWMKVNLDGVLYDKCTFDGDYSDPDGIVELKTSGNAEDWENGVPIGYKAQVLYCMNVLGVKRAHLYAMIENTSLNGYEILPEDEIFDGMNMNRFLNEIVESLAKDLGIA